MTGMPIVAVRIGDTLELHDGPYEVVGTVTNAEESAIFVERLTDRAWRQILVQHQTSS
jgi:hypothetical protein